MSNETFDSANHAELRHRLIRIGGILLGVLGLFLFFVGGALSVLGFAVVWRMGK